MKKAEALKCLKKLESLAGALGQSSALIPNQAKLVASELNSLSTQSSEFSIKLSSYLQWIEIGNSPRKSEKYPGGVAGVERFARQDCATMGMIIDALKFDI